jgi:hypothetical protein
VHERGPGTSERELKLRLKTEWREGQRFAPWRNYDPDSFLTENDHVSSSFLWFVCGTLLPSLLRSALNHHRNRSRLCEGSERRWGCGCRCPGARSQPSREARRRARRSYILPGLVLSDYELSVAKRFHAAATFGHV